MDSTVLNINYILLLVAFAILILNIVFVYIPALEIQADIDTAGNDVITISEKVDVILNQYAPRVDTLLNQAIILENKINNLIDQITSQKTTVLTKLTKIESDAGELLLNIYGANKNFHGC